MAIKLAPEPWKEVRPTEDGSYPSLYYYEAIGRLVVRWTNIELLMRELVEVAVGLNEIQRTLFVQRMRNETLASTFVQVVRASTRKPNVIAAAEYIYESINTCRNNRNLVVHATLSVNASFVDSTTWKPIYMGQEVYRPPAVGKSKCTRHFLSLPALRQIADDVFVLFSFAWLCKPMFAPGLIDSNGARFPALPDPPKKMVEKLGEPAQFDNEDDFWYPSGDVV